MLCLRVSLCVGVCLMLADACRQHVCYANRRTAQLSQTLAHRSDSHTDRQTKTSHMHYKRTCRTRRMDKIHNILAVAATTMPNTQTNTKRTGGQPTTAVHSSTQREMSLWLHLRSTVGRVNHAGERDRALGVSIFGRKRHLCASNGLGTIYKN